ncbi:hypothetical protein E4U30_003340 [Claviceps sp. LM220 group G6]|nr:hypothetical protein E4U30_003340 [Claviceps sp. LM220 group G6]
MSLFSQYLLLEYALRSLVAYARNAPREGFALISADEKIEEETLPGYVASQFYPAKIGEILRARYQIVGKLGYGVTSTVLASTESKVSQAFSED